MMIETGALWAEYECEQAKVRRRELHELSDVSGADALDLIVQAIAAGKAVTRDDIRRRRLSSARRERAQCALRSLHAAAHECDLLYRSGPSAEAAALLSHDVILLPEPLAKVIALDAEGRSDREIARALGITATAARKRLSRAARRLAS